LPVDGRVATELSALDLSALRGESVPTRLNRGGEALSGATSVGAAFELVAIRPACESTYAGIVRLVEAAQSSKAPMARLADRYAVGFLLLTVLIASTAWFLSRDPIQALSVLLVATPCPLILAVPVAIISGMSRGAAIGVLIKGGGKLKMLARSHGDLGQNRYPYSGARQRHGYQDIRKLYRGRPVALCRKSGSGLRPRRGERFDSASCDKASCPVCTKSGDGSTWNGNRGFGGWHERHRRWQQLRENSLHKSRWRRLAHRGSKRRDDGCRCNRWCTRRYYRAVGQNSG